MKPPKKRKLKMKSQTDTISVKTKGFTDVLDITSDLSEILNKSGIKNGLMTVSVVGSTAGITSIEYEPGLVADLKKAFEKLIPEKEDYKHNLAWGDGNGFSHIRTSLLGFSKSVPIKNGEMMLGTWQQIVLVDFDNRPRSRNVFVQIIGE